MPLVRNGVTFSDAYIEAATLARNGRAMLDALEFYHPLLPERLRIVNDYVPLLATLEATAPADASTEVEWLACPVRIKRGDENDAAASPEYTIEVDNLAAAISAKLDVTRGSQVPWVCTARKYASDDTSAPAYLPPVVVELSSVTINGPTVLMSYGFGDAGNVGVPAITFNRDDYPTLVP